MKIYVNSFRLILILLLTQLFLSSDSFARGKRFVGVKYGVEKYNCLGFGLCLIFEQKFGEAGEFSSMNLEGDILLLEIPYAKAAEQPDAFAGKSFLMSEPYEIPMELCRDLGTENRIVLAKGEHPMIRKDHGYEISFKIPK